MRVSSEVYKEQRQRSSIDLSVVTDFKIYIFSLAILGIAVHFENKLNK